jgi:hypothetical protein
MGVDLRVERWVFLLVFACSSPHETLSASNGAGAGGGGAGAGGAGAGGAGQVGGSSGAGASSGGSGAGTAGASSTAGSGGVVDNSPACKALSFAPGIDPTFVPSSVISASLDGSGVGVDRQGRALLCGGWESDFRPAVARLREDGLLDTSFGNEQGVAVAQGNEYLDQYRYFSAPDVVSVDELGRVWMLADPDLGDVNDTWGLIARYDDAGLPDPAFDPLGMAPGFVFLRPRYDPTAAMKTGTIVPDASGAWLYYSTREGPLVDRILDDGSYDPAVTPIEGLRDVLASSEGTLYASHVVSSGDPGDVVAFDATGAVRTDFGDQGVVELSFAPEAFSASFLLPQPGGALVVGDRAVFLRLTAAGAHDTSFGTAGFASVAGCVVRKAARACEGRLVLAGTIGTTEYCAIVLTRDGVPIPETPVDGFFRWPAAEPPISSTIEIAIEPVRGRILYRSPTAATEIVRVAPPGSG